MKFSNDELTPYFEVRIGMSKHLDGTSAVLAGYLDVCIGIDKPRNAARQAAARDLEEMRQLARQIESPHYERATFSKNKAAVLTHGAVAKSENAINPNEAARFSLPPSFLEKNQWGQWVVNKVFNAV